MFCKKKSMAFWFFSSLLSLFLQERFKKYNTATAAPIFLKCCQNRGSLRPQPSLGKNDSSLCTLGNLPFLSVTTVTEYPQPHPVPECVCGAWLDVNSRGQDLLTWFSSEASLGDGGAFPLREESQSLRNLPLRGRRSRAGSWSHGNNDNYHWLQGRGPRAVLHFLRKSDESRSLE